MKIIFKNFFILFLLTLLSGCAGALHSAAAKGDIKALKEMLDGGANINESSMGAVASGPPLNHASYYCQVEAVKLLLEKGADVNATSWMDLRALNYATWKGCNKVAELLIDKGADLEAINKWGDSPLAWSAQKGQSASVKLLIESGADPDVAIRYLISRNENSAAQIVQQAAKSVRRGTTKKTPRYGASPSTSSNVLPTALPLPTESAPPF